MVRLSPRLHLGSRLVVLGLLASVAALAVSTSPADARRHRGKASLAHRAKAHYSPPYSAFVIDANSGKALHEASADSPRHPASLTKIMTLYLLFERLEAGKVKLNSEFSVSPHASAQAPSKLGLKPGETIRVEDAIRALVTKSANDAAVVVAENLGGDEPTFARMMTKKARLLGMRQTLYRNASGLPNPEQITSARDQALLGRAIQDRFPKYYRYFATHSYTYKGREMRNHNKLLGSVEGVDGIKTGYVEASGFNLVTSVRRSGRHLVAVVMGGRTAGARDARMRELIKGTIVTAAAKRTAPPVMEASDTAAAPVVVASAVEAPAKAAPAPQAVEAEATEGGAATISAPMALAPSVAQNAAPGSNDDLKPIAVKTVKVKASTLQTNPIGSPAAQATLQASQEAAPPREESIAVASANPAPAPNSGGSGGSLTSAPAQAAISVPATAAPQHGWMIQVGALETRKDADERIAAARAKARALLARAKAFTEEIIKNDMKLYRARFAGISKEDAESACKTLKSAKIVCMALRN